MMKYQHRNRSHTIHHGSSAATRDDQQQQQNQSVAVNLCGYDSYLHATICAGNGHHSSAQHSPNTVGVATPFRKKCNQKLIKSRLRHQQLLAQQQQAAAQLAQHQQYHQPQQQQQQQKTLLGLESSSKQRQQQQQQQQRKTATGHHRLLRSKSKEEIATRDKLNIVEGLLTTESFIDKLKITEDFAEKHVAEEKRTGGGVRLNNNNFTKQPTELIMEYGSVPVHAEPGECESLLRCSSSATTPNDEVLTVIAASGARNSNELFIEEQPQQQPSQKSSPTHSTPKSVTAVHRYGTHVHTHIHHHYHHFENEENVV